MYSGEADGRHGGPTISVDTWAVVLRRNGFSLDFASSDFPGVETQQMSLLIATKHEDHETNGCSDDDFIILEPLNLSVASRVLSDGIFSTLRARGYSPQRTAWPADLSLHENRQCISLLELDSPFLATLTEGEFHDFRQLMLQVSSILWITIGNNPAMAMFSGLARSLRNEIPGTRFRSLQLSSEHCGCTEIAAELVIKVALSSSTDTEYVEEDGMANVARLAGDELINQRVAALAQEEHIECIPLKEAGRPLELQVQTPGEPDSFCFQTDEQASNDLLDDEIMIEVEAIGMRYASTFCRASNVTNTSQCIRCDDIRTNIR